MAKSQKPKDIEGHRRLHLEFPCRRAGNTGESAGEPIPYELIEKLVKLRVKQDAEKAAAQRKTRR